MGFIDADAHIDETEETWNYMAPAEARHRPVWLDTQTGEGILPKNRRSRGVWLIGGNVWLRRYRDDRITGTTVGTRELMDVEGRLRHMDELGVDVQVIYPTTFIFTVTDQPEVEAAVHGAYNRWLADKTAPSGGRLRWSYLPPVLSMDRAVGEMEWARDHGACCVLRKGVEYNRPASDPYFFPLYEEAERLNIPVCFHLGNGSMVPNVTDAAQLSRLNLLAAFAALTEDRVAEQFTSLRFGFIEAGAQWIPYMMKDLAMRGKQSQYGYDYKTAFLKRNRFFVTCDTEDDLPYLLQYGAEDQLMIGTDYSHADQSAELRAPRVLVERAEKGELPAEVVRKIVSENARAFYGL